MAKVVRTTTTSEIESSTQEIIGEYKDERLSRNDAVIKIFPLVYRRMLLMLKVAFSILPPQDQDDLLQEVMLRTLRSLDTYDRSRGAFLPWLDEITRNVKIDYLNHKNRDKVIFRDPHEDSNWEMDNHADAHTDVEMKIDLHDVLQELSENERLLLHDKYFDGYTVPELAKKYGRPESTIKFHLREAVAKVCEKLSIDKKQGDTPSPSGESRSGGSRPSFPKDSIL